MGLGKTLQIIAFLHATMTHQIVKRYIQKTLIIVPYNVAQNWYDEFLMWLSKCHSDVPLPIWPMYKAKFEKDRLNTCANWKKFGGILIISNRLATNMILDKKNVSKYKKYLINCDLLVIDEGHLLKNYKTAYYQAIVEVKTKRRILLTGTPMQNNLSEYFFMIDLIKPRLLGTKEQFKQLFENPIAQGQHTDSTKEEIRQMNRRLHVFLNRTQPFLHRRDVDILIPYLPPKQEYIIGVRLSSIQSDLYRYFLTNLIHERKNLLRDSLYLMLLGNHPSLLIKRYEANVNFENEEYHPLKNDEDCFHNHWRKVIANYGDIERIEMSTKFMLLLLILKQCESIGDKILVFSQSLLTLDLIEKMIDREGWHRNSDYFRIDGGVSVEDRHESMKKFNDMKNLRARLMLISIKAGGIGINLIGANRCVLFDCSWNPATDLQAIFRVFRLGQTKPVFIYRLVAYGTMEWKIYERQVWKTSIAKRVVDIKQIMRHYTKSELAELYTYEPDIEIVGNVSQRSDDRLLNELLRMTSSNIVTFHHHDSLFQVTHDEELNEKEKTEAIKEFSKLEILSITKKIETKNDDAVEILPISLQNLFFN
ncbi:hypothetical protein QR98_0039470 [Sarcoptes scabiei]|nr:hypothetical protein QR98_0039470 [Sarcoptes scabiei]